MLGILDWGIGGIGVYRAVKRLRPDSPLLYFSDTGATPYGKMSRGELKRRLERVIDFLTQEGAENIIIACNAASTAIRDLSYNGKPTVEGIIEPAIELAARTKPKRLAVIGGRRTFLSGIYREAFAKRGITVRQRIAQPLSAMIELGDTSSKELRTAASQILKPLRNSSHILLACTHYPAIEPLLRELVAAETVFLDPADELARRAVRHLGNSAGEDRFFTSGDSGAMKRAAKNAFGVSINRVETAALGSAAIF